MRNLTDLSELIRELYFYAAENDPEEIARFGVEAIRRAVGIDAAWFGWATFDRNATSVKASATCNLPGDYPDFWSQIAGEDVLARELREYRPGLATYSRNQRLQTEGMRALCEKYGIEQMACSAIWRPGRSTSFFLSGYRATSSRNDWKKSELATIATLAGQMECAMRTRMWMPGHDGFPLLVDDEGRAVLGYVAASRQFPALAEIMTGDDLRKAVWQQLRGKGGYDHTPSGLSLRMGTRRNGPMQLNVVNIYTAGMAPDGPENPADSLTPREREVAGLLLKGLTTREIATRLGTSHATVRNQTQAIYLKLGISRRIQLSTAIGQTVE